MPRSRRVFGGFLGIALLPALLCFAAPSYATERVCNLGGAQDPALQEDLVRLADEQGLTAAAERGDLAIGLLILTDPDHPRLAQINGYKMVYAASLIDSGLSARDACRLAMVRPITDDADIRSTLDHAIDAVFGE